MMNLYLLNLNGAEAGPFTEQQLRALWLTGGVTVATEWRLAPQGQWRDGTELPALLEPPAPAKPRETKILVGLQFLTLLVLLAGASILASSQLRVAKKPDSLPMKTVWEYKTVDCHPYKTTGVDIRDDESKTFDFDEREITDAGKDGWELCGVFPEIETVFPTETHSNVRIETVTLFFKRSHQEVDEALLSVHD